MRAARDEADVDACARELHAEITADRAGAVNSDLQETYLETNCKGTCIAEGKYFPRQAGTACGAAIASSSNAVEISRMLITPHRL